MLPTYLSHDLTQRHLFEVGGLATHVGPCDEDEVASLGDVAAVGDGLLPRDPLQDGVSALLDGQRVSEFGANWKKKQKNSTARIKTEVHTGRS